MPERTTTMRLRSVRFKDGRAPLRVFRPAPPSTEVATAFSDSARRCSESGVGGPEMVGYAIVAWDASGEVFVAYRNSDRSGIPSGGVGQYAKDVLLAEQAVRWSRDD